MSTPDESPVRLFSFPDQGKDTVGTTVGNVYDSDGNGSSVLSHWDTFHAEKKLPSIDDVPIEEQAEIIPTILFLLITDQDIQKIKVD